MGPRIATRWRRCFGVFGRQWLLALLAERPAGSPDHYQAQLLVEASRFYSQLTKWDDRFGGLTPHRIPHLVYAPFPFDAEVRLYPGGPSSTSPTRSIKSSRQSIAMPRSLMSALLEAQGICDGQHVAIGGRCGFGHGELFALPVPVVAKTRSRSCTAARARRPP